MDTHWNHIESVLDAVLEADPTEWPTLVKQACGDDDDLLREVEELLGRMPDIQNFLQTSVSKTLFEKAAGKSEPVPENEIHKIDRYRIIRELARGGMGRVFLAERADGQFEQQVALKLLHSSLDSEPMQRRFRAERQILASLNHDNIARLFDGGITEEGRPYIVMEFIEGEPIDQYCDNRQLSINQRLELFISVCEAVQYAHRKLVVHRDLKPSNIWVTQDGVVKLLDFGIAKVLTAGEQSEGMPPLTQTGLLPLTPAYASPEQIRNQEITTASDVFQLGVVLYELLTGSRPYNLSGKSPGEIERIICDEPPAMPGTVAGRYQKQLRGDPDTIVMKALRKEPERRFDSAEQLAADLRNFLAGRPVLAHPDSWSYRAGKFIQRHKQALVIASFILIGITGLITYYTWQLAKERDIAQLEAQKAELVSSYLADMFRASNPADAQGEALTARELLDRGAQRIDELAGQPEVQAGMMSLMGKVYLNLGHYNEARNLFEQEFEILNKLYDDVSPELANNRYFTGRVLHDIGNYQESIPYFEAAIEIYRGISDYISPDYASGLEMMGHIEHVRRNHDTGAELIQESLEIMLRLFGPDHPELAGSYHSLGSSQLYQEDRAGAVVSFREALRIIRLHQLENTQQAADILEDLGRSLGRLEQFDEAEAYLNEAYTIQNQMYGDSHFYIGLVLRYLAELNHQRNEIYAADSLYTRAVKIMKETVGDPHPMVAQVLSSQGDLYILQGNTDYERAEERFREALTMYETTLHDGHSRIATLRRKLGSVLVQLNRFEEAEELLLQSLSATRILLEEHPGNQPYQRSVTSVLEELVVLYKAWDNSEMAEHYKHQLSEIRYNDFKPDSLR